MYVDSQGNVVELGKELGRGGEGVVYQLHDLHSSSVAKIYSHQIPIQKQQKLMMMAKAHNEYLIRISAWPTDTIHNRDGSIIGFIMQRLSNYEPIHKLYSPTHRKQVFPKANWAYLVNVAKNLSAAFSVIHTTGQVIVGDVNQGNVYVSPDSTVKFIDCDSFQISTKNAIHYCEVGVSHFTPPEMQGLSGYHGFVRTQNHDNFGLAILCFHLLFMGRHPFSGVHDARGYVTLEDAIKTHLFAFSRRSSYRMGVRPPPNSLTMDSISDELANLFELAFSRECSTNNNRPQALHWHRALDNFTKNLVSCAREPIHIYYKGNSCCPWCKLEKTANILFFVDLTGDTASAMSFDIEGIWRKIQSIPSPGPAPELNLSAIKVSPKPLPLRVKAQQAKCFGLKILAVAIFIVSVLLGLGTENGIVTLVGIVASIIVFNCYQPDNSEKRARQTALSRAEEVWRIEKENWQKYAGNYEYNRILKDLFNIKKKYESLPSLYSQEKQKLHANIRQNQLNKFLSQYFIDDHNINSIGTVRKAVLSSFGIETAADIDAYRVMSIEGFGQYLTSTLLAWRKSIESRFVFDPSKGVAPEDIKLLNHKFNKKKKDIENQIRSGYEMLLTARNKALANREKLSGQLKIIAFTYAQAQKDMTVF